MSGLFYFIYYNFGVNSWLTLILSIIIFITILFILFMSLILMLDSLYRPNLAQYPFNFILDRALPLIALFFPSVIIFFLHPFETWFERITLLIVIHTFILAPLFYSWSKLRNWKHEVDTFEYHSWNQPRLYLHIAIAMIYPLLWGVFFSLSRYFRLGTIYDPLGYIQTLSKDYIIIFFIFPFIVLWFMIMLSFISKIRKYLWAECSTLLYSIHIYLLKYYLYFRFMELIYKSGFFVTCILTLNIAYKNQGPWWRRFLNYLYYNPKGITIFIFSIIIFEIVLTKRIFYSIFILFIYTSIYRVFSCYFAFAQTDFVFDCCLSDYCFLSNNSINPRYPQRFWMYFQDAEYHFGFEYEFTKIQCDLISEKMKKSKIQWLFRKKISQEIHQDYVNIRIQKKRHAPFCLRMAANYLHINRVRWVHTERIINTTYFLQANPNTILNLFYTINSIKIKRIL